jgi:hypothetical protein
MDKIARYKVIAKEVLQEVLGDGDKPNEEIKTQVISDDAAGHYLLFSNGWRKDQRVYGCYLHIDVTEDGKIWLQHDGTDEVVAHMIADRGVPKSDIMLGFKEPFVRADTGFAVA